MKLILLFLVLCLGMFYASGQEFSLQWGKELDASGKTSYNEIILNNESGVFVAKYRNKNKVAIDHFDKGFSSVNTFELNINGKGAELQVHKIVPIKSKIYVFYSERSKGKSLNTLYVDEIDRTTLSLKNEKKQLLEIESKDQGSFSFITSSDTSKLLIYYHSLPDDQNKSINHSIFVFDLNLGLDWKKQMQIPYTQGAYGLTSMRVDNESNAYCLIWAGTFHYNTYEIIGYFEKGDIIKHYPVEIEDPEMTIVGSEIEIVKNKLICAGFYGSKDTINVRGTYFKTIDPHTGELITKSSASVKLDLKRPSDFNMPKDPFTSHIVKESSLTILTSLIFNEEGESILTGEEYHRITQKTVHYPSLSTDKQISISRTHYYYNNVICVKIDSSNRIKWTKKIFKSQETSDDRQFYVSILPLNIKGHACFIFNDNPKNIDNIDRSHLYTYDGGKSVTKIIVLDPTGQQRTMPIFDTVGIDVVFKPKDSRQISDQEAILVCQKGKKQQFARLTFK